MAVLVNIGALTVNQISTNAGIFSGEFVQLGWNSSIKTNTGFLISGHLNWFFNNINLISDPDGIDAPFWDANVNATTSAVILKGT